MATQTKPATATGTLVDQLVDDQPAVTVPDASVDVATANKGVRESEQEQERTTRLDGQIRSTAGALDGGTVYLRQLIAKAKDTKENPHFLSLVGFKSWTDYIIDVMQAMANMHADVRAPFVEVLAAEGMTVRQIADATKTAKSQIGRDIQALAKVVTAEGKAEDAAIAKAKGAPKGKPQASHVVTAGQRLYKTLSVVTSESVEDGKKFTLADLTQLQSELARVSDVVDKQHYALTVDVQVKALLVDQENAIRAQVEAALISGVQVHPAGKGSNANPRTGRSRTA